jgi:enterochelin esterase family protein
MGGGQTVTVGMKHPELFSAFGIFSAGIFNGPQFETAISTFEKSVRDPAKQPLIWVAIGKDDFLMRQYGELKTRLNRNLKATYVETEGGHVWHLWRQYLADFAPLAFK